MKLTTISTLMMSTLMRMELFRSMDTLKVSLSIPPGTRVIILLRAITHTLAWAQKNLQRQMISPQMNMSLNHILKATIIMLNIIEEEDRGTVKPTET